MVHRENPNGKGKMQNFLAVGGRIFALQFTTNVGAQPSLLGEPDRVEAAQCAWTFFPKEVV
jgi:hypothetical protein